MTNAIQMVMDNTTGDIEDRMILVTTSFMVFLEYGQVKEDGEKISSNKYRMTYDHFLQWFQENMSTGNLQWKASGDDMGYRCMHIILKAYEVYVDSITDKPRRTINRQDLNYNAYFHPDDKPSKSKWEEMYNNGDICTKHTNPLTGLK